MRASSSGSTDADGARQQWVDTARRERADLGVDAARTLAQQAADRYATPPPPAATPDAGDRLVEELLAQLRDAWTEHADADRLLTRLLPYLEWAQAEAAQHEEAERVLRPLRELADITRAAADEWKPLGAEAQRALHSRADQIAVTLRADWRSDRPVAADAARAAIAGPGRLGQRRADVRDARQFLEQWASKWKPVVPELDPNDIGQVSRYAARHPADDRIDDAIARYAAGRAATDLPQNAQHAAHASALRQQAQESGLAYVQASTQVARDQGGGGLYNGPTSRVEQLPQLTEQVQRAQEQRDRAAERIRELTADPELAVRPDAPAVLENARNGWTKDRDTKQATVAAAAVRLTETERQQRKERRKDEPQPPTPGQEGPYLGR